MTSDTTQVLVDTDGFIATVTISNPKKRNPIGTDTAQQIVDVLTRLDQDERIRVIILTGAGTAFSAGGNLDEFLETVDAGATHLWESGVPWQNLYRIIPKMQKPVIARVDGPAMAGGCGLVASCDFAYATQRSVFGAPEIKIGLFTLFVLPGLLRSLRRRDALDLVFTGRRISADEAKNMGLINQVVPDQESLDKIVQEQAKLLATIPPATMRRARHAFAQIEVMDFEAGLELARGLRPVFMGSEELRQGIAQFLNHKTPDSR